MKSSLTKLIKNYRHGMVGVMAVAWSLEDKMRIVKGIAYFFICIVIFISCAGSEDMRTQALLRDFEQKKVPSYIDASRQKAYQNALKASVRESKDYLIGPEDLLEIKVFKTDIDVEARVSSQGYITIPLIGPIKASGLTAQQLEKEITDLLGQKYINNPQVSVFIKEYRSQRVAVIGAVVNPKTYELSGYHTLLDVISMAGGLTEDAGKIAYVLRSMERYNDKQGPPEETIVVDLEKLLVQGDMTLNIPVENGDVIHIPPAGQVFVGGRVKKPGAYKIRDFKTTVTQMISQAGGLEDNAKTEALLLREKENGEKETIVLDIKAMEMGKAKDILVKPNDIIIVPKSGIKSFLYGVRDFVKGIFSIGLSAGSL